MTISTLKHYQRYREVVAHERWQRWFSIIHSTPEHPTLSTCIWGQLCMYPGVALAIRALWMHMHYGVPVSGRRAFESKLMGNDHRGALDELINHILRVPQISPTLYRRAFEVLYGNSTLDDYAQVLAAALGELEGRYRP